MQIILVRHGEAEPLKRTDAERNLTLDGLHQAQQSGAWLLNHQYVLEGLFSSPYFRARQTANELSNILEVPVTQTDRLTPDRDPREVAAWLDALELPDEAVIALVCHMPLVGRLAGWLCDGAEGGGRFSLAEVRVIELQLPAAGQGKAVAGFVPH
jgi:phosphohistidine phosphatase